MVSSPMGLFHVRIDTVEDASLRLNTALCSVGGARFYAMFSA
jgi:hypothetical protein